MGFSYRVTDSPSNAIALLLHTKIDRFLVCGLTHRCSVEAFLSLSCKALIGGPSLQRNSSHSILKWLKDSVAYKIV